MIQKYEIPKYKSERIEVILQNIVDYFNINEFPKKIDMENSFEFFKNAKISEFIGVKEEEKFDCLFVKKHRNFPMSAHVKSNRYFCSSCKNAYDLGIVEALSRIFGMSIIKTQLVIFQKLNIQVDSIYKTKSIATMKKNIEVIDYALIEAEKDFIKKSKELYIYQKLMEYFSKIMPLFPIADGKIVLYMSLGEISAYLSDIGLKGVDKGGLSHKLNYLVTIGLLNKLTDNQIPERELIKAKQIMSYTGVKYRIDFWHVLVLDKKRVEVALSKIIEYKEYGITKKDFTGNFLEISEGPKVRKKLRPQQIVNMYYVDSFLVEDWIERQVKNKGWVSLDEIKKKYTKRKEWSIAKGAIYKLGLKKVRISKKIRDEYNIKNDIEDNSYIYKKEELTFM